MKLVIGGTISIILGICGLALFFENFADLIQGTVPLLLLLGGAVTILLNRDQLENLNEKEADETPGSDAQHREAVPESEPIPASEPAPEADAGPDPAPQAAGSVPQAFVGNEDSLVFHSLDCKFATSKKCTARFSTREEAVEKGYKPCSICKP